MGLFYFGAKVAVNAARRKNRREMREFAAKEERRRQKEWEAFLDVIADRTPLSHKSVRSTPPANYWFRRLDREFNRIEAGSLIFVGLGFFSPILFILLNDSWTEYFTRQPVTNERLIWSAVLFFGSSGLWYLAWDVLATRSLVRRINKWLSACRIDVEGLLAEMHRDYTASPESRTRDYTASPESRARDYTAKGPDPE